MRIAFLVHRFPELSETFVLNQVTGLIDAGHDVEIFAVRPARPGAAYPEMAGYGLGRRTRCLAVLPGLVDRVAATTALLGRATGPRQRAPLIRSLNVARYGRSAWSLSLIHSVAQFLDAGEHDIVHCQFGSLGRKALLLRELGVARGKLVVSFRGADLTRADRADRFEKLFTQADLLLPVCDALACTLLSLGCPADRVSVHRSGIRIEKFRFAERSRAPGEITRMVSIGRLVEKKGFEYALRGVARVLHSGRHIHYVIVGDGPLRGPLERLAEDLGIRERVVFAGARSHAEVLDILHRSHLLVAPSVTASDQDSEGIPNVLKEAMASGIPVVATRHSGIPELVLDGVSGLLVPERDVEALAGCLERLIDDPRSWSAMGRAGRSAVEARYSAARLTDELISLYEELLDPDRRSVSRPVLNAAPPGR